MTHVFNPGDLAYSLIKNKWVQLSKNNNPSIFNLSLRDEDSDNLYMDDGKVRLYDHPILLPLNPYDPTDPSMAYLQAFAMTQGWKCPICGMANNPNSAICINSWPMQYGTSVEWKHY